MHRLRRRQTLPLISRVSPKQAFPITSTPQLARSFGSFAGFKVPRARNEPNVGQPNEGGAHF